jgi:hypothetical protein
MLVWRSTDDDRALSQPGVVPPGQRDGKLLYIKARNFHRDLGV